MKHHLFRHLTIVDQYGRSYTKNDALFRERIFNPGDNPGCLGDKVMIVDRSEPVIGGFDPEDGDCVMDSEGKTSLTLHRAAQGDIALNFSLVKNEDGNLNDVAGSDLRVTIK